MPTYGLYGAYIDGYFNDNPNYVIGKTPAGTEIRKDFTQWEWSNPTGLPEGEYGGDTLQFTGYFTSSATGTHTFELGSDDAGYLWVGSTAETGFTVNNALVALPGNHGYYTNAASITLTQGVPYFIRVIAGNDGSSGEEGNPGILSLGYRLPGQSVYTYNATNSNVYTVQIPATPTPTPTPTLAGTATPTPTPTPSPSPTPTTTPTPTPFPPYGYFTRRNNQVTTYTNLTAVFAAYQGTRTKAATTGFLAGGVDLKDLLDPAIAPAEKIDFNTGFFANGVDLKDIFRAEGIQVTATPTPTPTTTGTPSPTNTPSPTPSPTPLPTATPSPTQPPVPSPPIVTISISGTTGLGQTVQTISNANGSITINTHIIWERSGSSLSTLGVWVANASSNPNSTNSTLIGSFTFSFFGVYQFYAVAYTNGGLLAYSSGIQTVNI